MKELRPQTLLFCAVLAFAIALSTLLRRRRASNWLFAAFAAALAFWYASQSFSGLFEDTRWERATAVLTILLPQFAVHLFESIVPDHGTHRSSALVRIASLLGIPMLALELSPYHKAPFSLGLAYFYVFGLLTAALLSLYLRGRRSPSKAARDRVRFLVAVGASAMTFTLADFLSFLGVYLPPIGAVLSIVFLFVLAESMTRARLGDLYDIATRLLVATALAFCLAGIFYIFVTIVGRFQTMYLNAVLAAIVFLVLFEPLRNEVQTRMHQFFFRERYLLETSVIDLRKHLARVLEVDEMVTAVLEGLEGSRRVTSAAVYLRDQEGHGFDLAGSVGEGAPSRIENTTARPILDPLAQSFSVSLEELMRDPNEGQALAIVATATLGPLARSILLAIRGEDDDLVGILCVTDDRVRDAFSPEETALLETVGMQMAITIANSRVYSRMKERDRLAALGAMAAGLAHEVKNPLGAIKGAAQVLEEIVTTPPGDSDGTSPEFVGIIIEEVNRLDRVVGSFLDYARPHAGNPIPVDINAAVRRTSQILSSQKTDEVSIDLELKDGIPRAKIDPEQFRQVLINLMQNAVQAMDGRGALKVTTSTRRAPRSSRGAFGATSEKLALHKPEEPEYVEVSVSDTGPGISQKVLKNLFVPFFTTKERGTGLGLAISQSIVQNAGGVIHVQTQFGAGTKFTVLLPAAAETGLLTPAPQAPSLAAGSVVSG